MMLDSGTGCDSPRYGARTSPHMAVIVNWIRIIDNRWIVELHLPA